MIMSVINYSIDQIKYEIPSEVLQEAFMPRRYDPARRERYRDNQLGVSIDSVIRKEVIEGRVAVDVNLCSGVETIISLAGLKYEQIDAWNYIYRIPDKVTAGRNITAVYSATFGHGYSTTTGSSNITQSSGLMDAAAGVMASVSPIPNTQTPYVTLIGENTVLINDVQALNTNLWLRCMLTHEPNFANIKPAYYPKFAELAILAAKAAIHNKLIIALDEGQIKAGASIGRFREVVDGYADANQMYREHLRDKWRVSSTMNDSEKYRAILRMTVGGLR
jgi:hypothetical protein